MSIGALAALAGLSGADRAASQAWLTPSAVFVQAGADGQTHQVTLGLTRNWSRSWELEPGRVTGYWEASASQWSYPGADGHGTAGLGQFGLIPVLRYRALAGSSPWFAELGVGATVTTVGYASEGKRFSTRFNFGDHLALGRSFGPGGEHELALRVEHFSNADIREPNPGATFVQLRYVRYLGPSDSSQPRSAGTTTPDHVQ